MKVKLTDERLRAAIPPEKLELLTRDEAITLLKTEHRLRLFLESHVYELEEKVLEIEGKYFRIKSQIFGRSSEKSPRATKGRRTRTGAPRRKAPKLPSLRYPNATIIDKHITCETPPECQCCGHAMEDSGMTETSECLTSKPKVYFIIRQHRHKYRCGKCHGGIFTTPGLPRIIPGSSYSDDLIADAALSKYCDLIPMERYTQIAKRQGFPGLPPQSLIGATFQLAEFLKPHYERLRLETLVTPILLADETPHRMLEGDERRNWFLWGFLSSQSCFYECHDTRSGDVAANVLESSNCDVLVTDVYAGYKKAVREANEVRHSKGLLPILMAYCNSHARRGFTKSKEDGPIEAEFMIDHYKEIYRLNAESKDKTDDDIGKLRGQMRKFFEAMKKHAEAQRDRFSTKSGIAKAFKYFLKNYEGLTLFLTNPRIPIDNNPSERLLRSPVVGRKTWYGTHSCAGAEAAAIHFSLIEACKLNNVNPRTYYKEIIERTHAKKPPLTPKEFAKHGTNSS